MILQGNSFRGSSADVGTGGTGARTGDLRQTLAPGEWDVFISYSRKDQAFATRLHALLNDYQPPRDLALPQRRLRVFLDTSDFVAANYKPAIRRHLKNASKLLVICSPNAAASQYVDPEIDDFAALRPSPADDARSDILSVIIDGLPANETTGPDDPRGAFPAALTRLLAMPIAIDYRGFDPRQNKLGEGKYHDAWFTLLAAVYGYDRATIEERERKRRRRILRLRAAISGAVSAGLAGLALWALDERSDAISQRTHAYARQLAAEAQVELADERAPAAPAVIKALTSVALESTQEAGVALRTGVKRLQPVPVGRLPLEQQDGAPASLTFSPDGKHLLGIGKDFLLLWKLEDMSRLLRHRIDGVATPVGFSSDGAQAVVVVRPEDAAKPAKVLRLDMAAGTVGETAYVRILDWTQDAGGLRAAVVDGTGRKLQLVDLVSARIAREVALGRAVKLGKFDARSGGVLLVDTANEVWSLDADLRPQGGKVVLPSQSVPLAFTARTGLLAVETRAADAARPRDRTSASRTEMQRMLTIVQAATGQAVMEVKQEPGDRFVDFTGNDGYFRMKAGRGLEIYSIGFKSRLLTVEYGRANDVNVDAMTEISRQIPIVDAAVTDDGALIVTAQKDGRVMVWRPGARPRYGSFGAMPMPDLRPLAQFDHGDTLGATATWNSPPVLFVSSDGRYIASQSDGLKTNTVGGVASANPIVRIWDLHRGDETARFQLVGGMAVAFASAGELVATLRPPDGGEKQAGGRLELWRLSSADAKIDGSSESVILVAPNVMSLPDHAAARMFLRGRTISQPPGAASADGRRLVWLGLDGLLRMYSRETKAVNGIDDLRPAAKRAYAGLTEEWNRQIASLDAATRDELSEMPPAMDPFSQYEAMQEKIRKGDTDFPRSLPTVSVAVAGNGCCAAVLVGPLLRFYDLETRRLMSERILTDVMPYPSYPMALPAADLLLSHDGRAYAVALDTWQGFKALRAAQGKQGSTIGGLAARRELRLFSHDSDRSIATIEQNWMMTPGPALPLSWPLAIDSQGRQIALQQITVDKGTYRNVAVLRLPESTVVFKTPLEGWAYDPLNSVSIAAAVGRRAAFSVDDKRIVLAETRPDCPLTTEMLPTGLPTQMPICARLATELGLWKLADGRRVAGTVIKATPGGAAAANRPSPKIVVPGLGAVPDPTASPPLRQVLSLALLDDQTVTRVSLDDDPAGVAGSERLTTEKIPLAGRHLIDAACSRLPNAARTIRREDWRRDLPGEPYRAICP